MYAVKNNQILAEKQHLQEYWVNGKFDCAKRWKKCFFWWVEDYADIDLDEIWEEKSLEEDFRQQKGEGVIMEAD